MKVFFYFDQRFVTVYQVFLLFSYHVYTVVHRGTVCYDASVLPFMQSTYKQTNLQELCWSPEHALSDKQIDQFLVIARSVGTFAR